MNEVELTNMVMVQNPQTGKVLVQQRRKSWKGIAFPGGHVEPGESFADSAVREIKEETGLDITNLNACGTIHWCHPQTNDRYLVFLYRTETYSGELLAETEEGRVWWEELGCLPSMELCSHFADYLPVFLNNAYSEAFADELEQTVTYR